MRGGSVLGWLSLSLSLVLLGVMAFLVLRLLPAVSPAAAGASTAIPYAVVVDGNAEASAPPDIAYVTLGVDSPAPTAAEATSNNATAMAQIIVAVKGQGIPDQDVRTQDFSVTPVYAVQRPGDSSAPAITGYRVRNTVRVTVEDVQKVGPLLDAGLAAHANSAVGVSFAIKGTTALQQQALKDAVAQARAKAEAIAAGAGLRLTGPYMITESGTQLPRPIAAAQPAADQAAATPIESGQLTVTAHVQVAFTYAH